MSAELFSDALKRRGSVLETKDGRFVAIPTRTEGWVHVPVTLARGGLAVTEAPPLCPFGGWAVTHVASGTAVARYDTKMQAAAAMLRLLRLPLDWHCTGRDLLCADRDTREAIQRAARGGK